MMSLLLALDELEPGKGNTLVHRWALSKRWLLCCDFLDSQQEEKRLWAHGGWDWAARSWMGSCTRYGSRRIRYRAWVKLQAKLLVHLGRREHAVTLYFTRKLSCSMRKEGRKGGLKARRLGLKWQWTFWSFLQMPDDPAYWSQVPFLNFCLLFLLRAVSQLSLEDSLKISAAECPESSQSLSTSGGRLRGSGIEKAQPLHPPGNRQGKPGSRVLTWGQVGARPSSEDQSQFAFSFPSPRTNCTAVS